MINKLDLSGEWLLCLDKECKGTDLVFDDTINLPNTTSNAKKGEYNTERETGFSAIRLISSAFVIVFTSKLFLTNKVIHSFCSRQ